MKKILIAMVRFYRKYISPYKGGEGCVRDVIEQVLRAKGMWLTDHAAFKW